MVLNVVGSNPTGHPKRKSCDFLFLFSGVLADIILSKKFKTFQKKKNFTGFRHYFFLKTSRTDRFACKKRNEDQGTLHGRKAEGKDDAERSGFPQQRRTAGNTATDGH